MDEFWAEVDAALDELSAAPTVESVIEILNARFTPSSGDAFFPGSGGDRQVIEALTEAGWRILWAEADYYFAAIDPTGAALTYTEGDVSRGDSRAR